MLQKATWPRLPTVDHLACLAGLRQPTDCVSRTLFCREPCLVGSLCLCGLSGSYFGRDRIRGCSCELELVQVDGWFKWIACPTFNFCA